MGRNNPPAIVAFLRLRRPMAALVALSLGMGMASLAGNQAYAQSAEQEAPAGAAQTDDNALDALTSAIAKYKNNLQEIKNALDKSPEPSKLTEELANSKVLIEDLTKRLTLLRDERDVLTAEFAGYRETTDATIASLKLDSERDRALMAQIQTELGETKGDLQDTVNARVALESLITEQQATADELEQQLRNELAVSQQQITGLQSVRDNLQGELNQTREASTAEVEKLDADLQAANTQIQALSDELSKSQEQSAALLATREALTSELDGVKQAAVVEAADLNEQIEAATNRANALGSRLSGSEKQALELQEAQQLLESELVKLTETSRTQTGNLNKQLELARQEIVDREASYEELSRQMADATAAAANQSAELAAALEETEQKLAETQQTRAQVQSEYAQFRRATEEEKKTLLTEVDQSGTKVVQLEATRDGLMGQISEAAVTAERCVADVGELGEQLIAALDHLEQLEAALGQAQAGRSALEAELAAARRENGDVEEEKAEAETTQ